MANAAEAVDAAIGEATKARALVSRVRSKQVSGVDLVASLKSTAYAWFNTHRPVLASATLDVAEIDEAYGTVLTATARRAAKSTYLGALAAAKTGLVTLRASVLTPPATHGSTDDVAPDFAALVGSAEMRLVLVRRWDECRKCVAAEAHLAAIVMMGGLLEALFVARANKLTDKQLLTNARSAPKDKSGKTINYQDWMLDSYIKVGHELKWITDSARQIADVLKEFRNYVYPAKELRHGVSFALNDSTMFWNVTKSLARQLLTSAQKP